MSIRRSRVVSLVAAISSVTLVMSGAFASTSMANTVLAKAATGSPIVVGNVGTYSGPIGSSNVAAVPVLKAWAKQVNAAGGINGHPVKIVSADDATSPSTNLTEVESQVSNQHVIAFVSNMVEATAQAAQTYLQGKKIPVVGGDQNLPTWFSSPMYFSTSSSPQTMNYGQVLLVKQQKGPQKLSIWACTDSPTCAVFASEQEADAAKIGGITLTGRVSMSLEQPSFASPCLSAKSAGATIVLPNVDPSTLQRIVQGCSSVGYHPTYLASTDSINDQLTSLPSITHLIGVQQMFPYFLTSGSAALAAYAKAIAGFTPAELNAGAAQAWAAAQLFEAAAKVGVPSGGTPTSAEILKGLYSLKADTLGGLTIPLSFAAGKPSPEGHCWFTTLLSGGKYSSPSGLKAQCTTAVIPGE